MTEIEKIKYAKSFIDKLANGINPLDDTPVSENDIVNNVRLSRCFFYVSGILNDVIEGKTAYGHTSKPKKTPFTLSEDQRADLKEFNRPVSITELSNYLNGLAEGTGVKKISTVMINDWLEESGLLEQSTLQNGKKRRLPTASGKEMGIFTEERDGMYGKYTVVLFNPQCQRFVFDNLDSIISANLAKKAAKRDAKEKEKAKDNSAFSDFYNRPWTEAHDSSLAEMLDKGASVPEMAHSLRRTEEGIMMRLKTIGKGDN